MPTIGLKASHKAVKDHYTGLDRSGLPSHTTIFSLLWKSHPKPSSIGSETDRHWIGSLTGTGSTQTKEAAS